MIEKTVIHVDGPADPSKPTTTPDGAGLFFDGRMAQGRDVRLSFDDGAQELQIIHADQTINWPYGEIRALPDQAGEDALVLRLKSDPVARLIVRGAEGQALIRARAKSLHKRAKTARRGRLLAWAVAAVASVALIVFVLVPTMADQLAEYLPPAGEKALGDATFEQIRGALDDTGFSGLRICEQDSGLAALAKIEKRLTENYDLETPLTVHVLDHPMVNAFALPGGYVVFFNGLLREAESPEEIAAVFAHEIGHVAARDPTRIALRSAGSIGVLGLLLGDFAGGAVVLFLAERIIQADYTQEAEAAADAFAHDMLLAADLPPSAIATLFERMSRDHDHHESFINHLQSHPAMGDRIAAARAAEPEGAEFRRLLTEREWIDLRRICN